MVVPRRRCGLFPGCRIERGMERREPQESPANPIIPCGGGAASIIYKHRPREQAGRTFGETDMPQVNQTAGKIKNYGR